MNLRDSVRKTARKANITEATVLTYGGGYASVMVGSSGRMIHGIKVVGGVPVPGEKVDIDYSTDVPVVRSRAGGSSAGVVNLVQGILGSALPSVSTTGTGATTDSPPPSSDWFFQAGWTFGTDGSITSLTGDTVIKTNGEIVLGTANDVAVMSSADATYRFWAGNAVAASAPFSVTKAGFLKASSAEIGGWQVGIATIYDISNSIILNSTDATVKVGNGAIYMLIDGKNDIIKSSNYNDTGDAGFGLFGDTGDADFNNVRVRGTISASVMNIGEITATAGTSGVWKSATKIYSNATAAANGSTFTLNAEDSDTGLELLHNNNVIRIKAWNGSSLIDFWGEIEGVTSQTGYTSYTVRSRSGGGADIKKGMAVVEYGESLDGYITMSADGTVGQSANIAISEVRLDYVNTVSVSAGGTGYEVGDILTLVDAGSSGTAQVEVLTTSSGPPGPVATVSVVEVGYDYSTGVKSTTGGTGSSCTINITDVNDPWNSTFLKLKIGNMYNSYGLGTVNRYGIGIGDYASGNYISYNAESLDSLVISQADGKIEITGTGIRLHDTSTGSVGRVAWVYNDTYDLGGVYGDYGGTGSAVTWVEAQVSSSHPWTHCSVNLSAWDITNSKEPRLTLATNTSNYGTCVLDDVGVLTNINGALVAQGAYMSGGTSGAGVEVAWNSTYGRVLAYNRSGTYQPLRLEGSYVDLYDSNSLVIRANGGDLFTTGWTNYSGSSSITGWSSRTTTKIYYKRVGKTMFVYFEIDGTSDSISTSFTLPHAAQSNITTRGMCLAKNAGSWGNGSVIHHAAGSSTCTLYWYIPTGPWTDSGTKTVYGHYHYQMA